ncbi:DNA gyrase subunit A [Geodia barretti]|uniref:DNA topoisomerase (ATP-hydrolyzing) n=3 Tax=Geodia barretti TaxID=519541 RepID=A0AA35RXC2_GEOBA|nr:DNA gyrase subunit A [Geodia barretti]
MTTAPPTQPGGDFTLRPIEDEMRESYLSYAMSVIVARALPDVRDGMKPVQRRILYAMHDMGIRPGSQYRKSARIVGEVLGKFHPHGDASVYDALVRMAQLFSMRAPLIDGQGNFGSIDGDPPAAMRYTEARLAAIADELLADIDQQTVDYSDNFDDSLKEPRVLPARMPNLLVNGSSGIAVGMATNMPPHNLGEICDAINYVIDNPTCNVDQLMEIVPAPDFPTSGRIRGVAGVRDMYATGRGRIIMEAVTEIEDMPGRNSNRQRIIISELPFQVNKATLVEKIATLVRDKTLVGITEIRDESDRRGIRVVIELARSAQPTVILNNLYKRTALRSSFNAIMLALVDGQPQELPLKDLINHFVTHREEVIRRRTEYQLGRARDRAHIVEGLLKALDAIDAIIETIRSSQDVETARNNLVQQFDLSEIQAQAILDMQLRRLAALERQRLDEEYNDLLATISRLEDLLQNPQKIRAEIKRETREVKRKHADPRRTVIIREELQEQSIEQFIVQEDVVVTLSQRGYIKRVPIDTYRTQRRGGKGVRGANNRDDDVIMQIAVVNTHEQLLFFTNKGRVYPLSVYETPNDSGRTARGTLLVNLVPLQPGEHVQTMLPASRDEYNRLYVFATRNGRVNALRPGQLQNLRKSGLIAMKVLDGDELVAVRPAQSDASIILVTEQGQALLCPVTSVPERNRNATGVIGIKFKDEFGGKDHVVALEVVNDHEDEYLLVVSEKGYGKATPLCNSKGEPVYRETNRGGMGVKTFAVDQSDKLTGPVVDAKIVTSAEMNDEEGHEVFIISARGQVVRINLAEIKVVNTRQTKGVIIWRERGGDDSVVSIYCFRATDYSQDDPALQDGAAGTALAQAEEVAAQADSQYEEGEDEDVDEDTADDDIDDDGDGDDDPDTHVNGQAPLL